MSALKHTHQLLELHQLDYVVFQWDGGRDSAKVFVRELELEMRTRDANVLNAHARFESSTRGGARASIDVQLARKTDGQIFSAEMTTFDWLVISLHEGRLYGLGVVSGPMGDAMFRRVRPVVQLRMGEPMKLPEA